VAGQTPFRYLAQQMKRTYDKNGKRVLREMCSFWTLLPPQKTASWFRKSYWVGQEEGFHHQPTRYIEMQEEPSSYDDQEDTQVTMKLTVRNP
jgi:hypothetical protein